jgi:hypothetical protein
MLSQQFIVVASLRFQKQNMGPWASPCSCWHEAVLRHHCSYPGLARNPTIDLASGIVLVHALVVVLAIRAVHRIDKGAI